MPHCFPSFPLMSIHNDGDSIALGHQVTVLLLVVTAAEWDILFVKKKEIWHSILTRKRSASAKHGHSLGESVGILTEAVYNASFQMSKMNNFQSMNQTQLKC